MDACGYPNFSIQDLLNPESTRFREQLSGAVNFAKFREDRIEVYERHAAETVRVCRIARRPLAAVNPAAAQDEIVEHLQKIQQSIDEHRQRAEELRCGPRLRAQRALPAISCVVLAGALAPQQAEGGGAAEDRGAAGEHLAAGA